MLLCIEIRELLSFFLLLSLSLSATAKSLSPSASHPSESTSTSRHPPTPPNLCNSEPCFPISTTAFQVNRRSLQDSTLPLNLCDPSLTFASIMAYYDDRRYREPRDRYAHPVSYTDPYDDPRGRHRKHERDSYVPRTSNDSMEEVRREYPPGSDYAYERGYTSQRPRRPAYGNVRRASSVNGYDPHYDTAYRSSRPRRARNSEDRSSRRSKYDSTSSSSRSPPRHSRRKSFSEQAMGALGLGGAAASSSRGERGRGRSPSRHRHRSYSRSPSDSRSRSRHHGSRRRDKSEQRIVQAARAALTAGAVEAFKQRKQPGDWAGAKGKRVLTAAVTAGGADGLVDKDPKKHGTRHVLESTLAGLAASHFIGGGSRSQSRGRHGRSSGSSAIKNLAATGALTAAGKEIFDRVSRSRSRHRGRSDSRDSDETERGSKKRSKSVSEYITKGIAALGLGEQDDRRRDNRDEDREHRREHRGHRDDRDRRHHRGSRHDDYSDSDADSDYYSRDSRRGRSSRDVGRHRADSKYRGHASSSESDSELGDSSDEKRQRKKLKRDMLLTGGLASVATIHAVHGLYGSMEKRKQRMQMLKEGEITPEEARKRRIKANTMDAVSIGFAALGIKGAYDEWKEVVEKRKETNHFQEECAHRAVKRERRRARSQDAPSRHRWPDEIEYAPSVNESRSDGAPVYRDGNPYRAHETPQISY
ncbi:hypothetical protein N7457_000787 [Penicillium paradoxum]|uniref:uncharacterized protein n=1 Tax=Penicillium paradoxum TaxID=176176 RepID=UPI002548C5D5|nr:uncharacterized protein N7457_000787 [Penicillium paradoxum]KAJ5794188.1 hypothetical protein N7457_000787 [Penicillium paradoxum]